MNSISIVIPAYNEEQRLGSSLASIRDYLEARGIHSYEIVVVDDGSTDRTVEVAEAFCRQSPNIRVLRNPGNQGKGYTVRHGILEAQGEWILFTDADLSAPIEELSKLQAAVSNQQAQIAFGSRALDRSLIEVHQSWFRETAGRIFNLCLRILTCLPFHDTQCGFKLFSREAARQVFSRQLLTGFAFDVEVLYIARKLGFKCVEVPVRWRHAEGTKVRLFRDSVRMFMDLLRIRWNDLLGRYA